MDPGAPQRHHRRRGRPVGHATRDEPGWLTGVTVVVPPSGTVGGVDVRGGGPGTRETDPLDPRNLVTAVDAVVLSGGSAFGLAAADGVGRRCMPAGRGWPVGRAGPGGPHRACGDPLRPRARRRLRATTPVPGTGARHTSPPRTARSPGHRRCRDRRQGRRPAGGVGSASAVLPVGATVGALVVSTPPGSPVDAAGRCSARRWGLGGEFAGLPPRPEAAGAYWRASRRSRPPCAPAWPRRWRSSPPTSP